MKKIHNSVYDLIMKTADNYPEKGIHQAIEISTEELGLEDFTEIAITRADYESGGPKKGNFANNFWVVKS